MHIRHIRVFEKACFQRGLLQFPHAPITVQNGRLLARSQNAMFRNENKAFQTMLRAVGAFFRLKQWGLTRKAKRARHKGPVLERPELTMAQKANDVWTVDFKGWFRTGDGARVEPLTVRDLASRYVLGIILFRQQNVEDCRRAFERIFCEYGLPLVIRADNGTPFGATGALGLTRLSAW